MKPSFTLSFTDDAIQLLHRVGRNWVVIGETPFAAPDLDDALDYMRKTALGLEPGGFTTKLVIPNSQIRYLEVEAPGPSDDERRTQILAALADKTPYAPEELVFDWSGRQKTVRVAAVARETLQEAEGFAVQHRFNPVGFAAIPSEDAFAGEPWFGLTEGAQALIGADQTVERDRIAVRILAREMPKPDPAPDPADAPPTVAEPAAKAVADPPSQMPPETAADAAAETAPETAVPDQAISEKALPEAARDRQGQLDIHEPLSPAQAFALRDQPAGGNAFPESDSDEDTGTAADNQPDAAVGPAEIDADALLAALQPMADAQPPHTEKTEIPQEAPFTHVTEDAAPAADAAPSPKADLMPGSDLIPGGVGIPDDDDIPPAPSDAARVAFASRRSVDGGAAPSLGAAARPDASALSAAARGKPIEDLPPMPRPPQAGARPAAPAAGALRGGMVKGLGALVSTPVAGAAKKVKIKPGPLPPPPTQTPRSQLAAAAAAPSGAADAARSLSRPGSGLGGRPMMPKKSRAGLFLTLVAVLLLCLALIAAWSSFYLGAQAPTDPTAAPEAVAADTTAIPAVEDEMLADGEGGLLDETAAADAAADPTTDAAAVADALADVAAEPAADPAADAGVAPETAATDGPAAAPPIENHDETFLATSDAPPPALDALSLPAPEAAPDGLPTPQMPPPPFGTVYAFDENGMLLPTPEGITSPEGVLL
ncbi:MAG: hypothetical protein WAT09_01020, partial [Paracoccaceae bacterium]